MGCDIHVFVEYRSKKKESASWMAFGKKFHLPRDYEIFGLMAGVRGGIAIYPPKGLPDKETLSFDFKNSYYLWIYEDSERGATESNAARWVAAGYSSYVEEDKAVTDPDAHTPSWLTKMEFENVLKRLDYTSIEYDAVLAAMESFELNGFDARIVFWFDN